MLKIAIVGAGIIAKNHKNAVVAHPDTELVAVCDVVEERAVELANGTDARTYTDYKVMAENEEFDAVILNLPHFLHKEVSVYFLDRKVSVLVEKPMAITVEECKAMDEAAKRNGVKLAVGHLQRYYDCYQEIKKIIEDGRYGELCSVTEVRNVDYFTGRPQWFLSKKLAGGGIVMNYCAHTLDKFFYLCGTDVDKVCANVFNKMNDLDVESHAQVLLRMKNGVSASFSYSSSVNDYMYETYFYFTNGVARVKSGRYLELSQKGKPFERMELDYGRDPMDDQFKEFVKLIKGEEANIVGYEIGEKVISVIEQIFADGEAK